MSAFFQTHRIRRKADFQTIREQGKRIHCGAFILQALRRTENSSEPPRLAVIASRRVGGAVIRNRSRRLMREIFRRNLGELPLGLDLVIVMRSTYQRESYQSLEARYLKACQCLRLEFSRDESYA